jgi:hypothetical protein
MRACAAHWSGLANPVHAGNLRSTSRSSGGYQLSCPLMFALFEVGTVCDGLLRELGGGLWMTRS